MSHSKWKTETGAFSWEMNSSPITCDMPTVISHATSLSERPLAYISLAGYTQVLCGVWEEGEAPRRFWL